MSENEKNESQLADSKENTELDKKNLDEKHAAKIEIKESPMIFYKLQLNELKELLEKEKQNTTTALDKLKRARADYENLEKQTTDRINVRVDKIILDFLTVYEDFIRAKNAYEGEGGNVDNLNSIIKNMESILDHYEVKPIETEGKKLDPKLHEVIEQIEDSSHDEGIIVKEIAKGYIIRGKVMKYSKVCVSKKLIKK